MTPAFMDESFRPSKLWPKHSAELKKQLMIVYTGAHAFTIEQPCLTLL